jgi:hypothetical protein
LANVIQDAVIGLANDGIGGANLLISGQAEQVGKDGIRHTRHTESTGQDYGRLKLTQFLHLCEPGEFPKPIPDNYCRWHLLLKNVATVRQDRSHAGVDRGPPRDGHLPNQNPGDVCDCIKRPRRQDAYHDSKVTRWLPSMLRRRPATGTNVRRAPVVSGLHHCAPAHYLQWNNPGVNCNCAAS